MAIDKHINFFELEKACEQEGCPLCRIVNDRTWRYLDNMLFEHISDRPFRAAHRAAGGFCREHSKNLSTFRDGLAVAILGRDILEDRIESFRKNKPWKPRERCPICVEEERIEVEYLSFLAESGGQSPEELELRRKFTASEGLCAPHYEALLRRTKKIPVWLRDFQEAKFTTLLERVNRFIDLSAYGKQDQFAALSEADKVVWKELARTLRGTVQ
ncbi:MAG: hypothetical protein GX438_12055 [Treponema sp.]|nr:hypothetical protein [Treponema sp.]